MNVWVRQLAVIAGMVLLASSVLRGQTQPAASAGTKVRSIKGLSGVKDKTSGRLTMDGQNLQFTHEQIKVDVAAASVEDVVTGNDSQRLIHGTLGTLTMFAPYESGRFLSLFRTKLDTLTIKYRDTDGGLHGAIFTMPVGKADLLKKDLLAQGAHSTVPIDDNPGKTTDAKGQKR